MDKIEKYFVGSKGKDQYTIVDATTNEIRLIEQVSSNLHDERPVIVKIPDVNEIDQLCDEFTDMYPMGHRSSIELYNAVVRFFGYKDFPKEFINYYAIHFCQMNFSSSFKLNRPFVLIQERLNEFLKNPVLMTGVTDDKVDITKVKYLPDSNIMCQDIFGLNIACNLPVDLSKIGDGNYEHLSGLVDDYVQAAYKLYKFLETSEENLINC